jgi:hypothetical protein
MILQWVKLLLALLVHETGEAVSKRVHIPIHEIFKAPWVPYMVSPKNAIAMFQILRLLIISGR